MEPLFGGLERCVDLEPRYDAAARPMQTRPPAIVVIAKVEHISRARLDGHVLGGGHIVDAGLGDLKIKGLHGVGIVDDMRLGAANACRKRRPIAAKAVEADRSGIDQPEAIADFPAAAPLQFFISALSTPAKIPTGRDALASDSTEREIGPAPRW